MVSNEPITNIPGYTPDASAPPPQAPPEQQQQILPNQKPSGAQGFFPPGYQFAPTGGQQTQQAQPGGGGGAYQPPKMGQYGLPETTQYEGYSSETALLWSMESNGANQDQTRAVEQQAFSEMQARALGDPTLAANLQGWTREMPSIPGGVLLALAQAGVTPDSPIGKWLLSSMVPAFSAQSNWRQKDINDLNSLVNDPDLLGQLNGLSAQQAGHVMTHGPQTVGRISANALSHLEQTGHLPDQGWMGYVGDISRPVFAALQGGFEGLTAVGRGSLASLPQGLINTGGDVGKAITPSYGTTDRFGIHYGTPEDVANIPGQLTIAQWLSGKSLGQGLFPGGAAQQAAVKAQQMSAEIDGHALTPGRAYASVVFTPGSTGYKMLSGAIDFGVALEGDPAANLMSQLGESIKGARQFATTTDEAISATADHILTKLTPENAAGFRDWAGMEERQGAIARAATATAEGLHEATVAKLTADPGSIQQLVDRGLIDPAEAQAAVGRSALGMTNFLRERLNPQNALQYFNSPAGNRTINKMATATGYDIYKGSGHQISPELSWALGDMTNPDDIRATLGQAVMAADQNTVPFMHAHPFEDARWFAHMPNYGVDMKNTQQVVDRAIQELTMAKIPRAEWDGLLKPLAQATDEQDTFKAFMKVGNRIGDQILSKTSGYIQNVTNLNAETAKLRLAKRDLLGNPTRGLTGEDLQDLAAAGTDIKPYTSIKAAVGKQQQMARDMTTYFPQTNAADRQYWLTINGEPAHVPGLTLDGTPMAIEGPYVPSEFHNGVLPVLGADGNNGLRNIRQQIGVWHHFWQAPIIGPGMRSGTYLMDNLTGLFKFGALARLALPVRMIAESQARMASAGFDSFFNDPIDYISHVVGGGKMEDLAGNKFTESLSDAMSQYARSVGDTGSFRQEIARGDQWLSSGWQQISRGQRGYNQAWLDRLGRSYADPISRAVAKAMVNGEPLDQVKNDFAAADGVLGNLRQDLVRADLKWGSANLVNRANSDAYIDSFVQRLNDFTANGDETLMKAVAGGDPWVTGEGLGDLKSQIAMLSHTDQGPLKVVGPMLTEQKAGVYRRATSLMFSALMDRPSNVLMKSPLFKQAYFQRAQELLPHLDDATRASVLERAQAQGINLVDNGVRAAGPNLSLDQFDKLSKDFGLQTTHRYLYYPGERSNAADILRNIMPFGQAWQNIISTWSKLAMENPAVIRRVQQGVTSAQQSGWWYKRSDGTEVFTIVPGSVTKKLTGLDWPMVGNVSGLNLVGTGLPGVGPAVQWGAPEILKHFTSVPFVNDVNKWMQPYGNPDFAGGSMETLFPGWMDKFRVAGYFAHIPYLTPFLTSSLMDQNLLSNTAKQAVDFEISTGHYNWHDPNVIHTLTQKAMDQAKKLYFWRGLAQFVSPAAPSFIAQNVGPHGGMIEQAIMAKDYQNMISAANGNEYQATMQFGNKYGWNNIFASQPMTKLLVPGLPTTIEANQWAQSHPTFAAKYPSVYGFFAPNGGGSFDRSAYLSEIASGKRQVLTPDQWVALAEARVGGMIYNELRKKVGASPSRLQQSQLDQAKTYLTSVYPGFGEDSTMIVAKNKRDQTITQIGNAMNDKAVANTPLAQAARVYMDQRNRALSILNAAGVKTLSGTKNAEVENMKAQLYAWGTFLAEKTPEFAYMWNSIFQPEVDPNG